MPPKSPGGGLLVFSLRSFLFLFAFQLMLNNDKNVEECDATKADSSNGAGLITF